MSQLSARPTARQAGTTHSSRIIDLCLLPLPLISDVDGLHTMPDLVWERNQDSVGPRIAPPLRTLPFHSVDPFGELTRYRQPVGEKWRLVAESKPHQARRIGYGPLGAN
jgi:hypothetical protein